MCCHVTDSNSRLLRVNVSNVKILVSMGCGMDGDNDEGSRRTVLHWAALDCGFAGVSHTERRDDLGVAAS